VAVGYWDVFQNLIYQLSHEDDLLVSRTGWLLGSQFVLLVGYVLVDLKSLPSNSPIDWRGLIRVVGLLSTICIFSSILAAVSIYVGLRSALQSLVVQHADLPMRDLPHVGIGPGLLCPILLALIVVYVWALLTSFSRTAAGLMTASGICFSVYAVALGDLSRPGPIVALAMWPSVIAALAFLAAALTLGARSIKGSA
jgi:hypothetical protein